MSKLEDAKAIISAYKAEKEAEKVSPDVALKEAENEQIISKKQMEEALVAGDLKTYKKAKKDFDDATEAINFYNNRGSRYISEDEYQTLTEGIREELRAFNEEKKKRVVAILDELDQIREELSTLFDEGDNVLRTLQEEVYRDPKLTPTMYLKAFDVRMKDSDYGLIWYLGDILMRARTAEII